MMRLAALDLFTYSKTDENVRERTVLGGVITVACIGVMALSAVDEFALLQTIERSTSFSAYVLHERSPRAELHVDVWFPSLGCDDLVVDVVDGSGASSARLSESFILTPTDSAGRPLGSPAMPAMVPSAGMAVGMQLRQMRKELARVLREVGVARTCERACARVSEPRCPRHWRAEADGSCIAPAWYGGPCAPTLRFASPESALVAEILESCEVDPPCARDGDGADDRRTAVREGDDRDGDGRLLFSLLEAAGGTAPSLPPLAPAERTSSLELARRALAALEASLQIQAEADLKAEVVARDSAVAAAAAAAVEAAASAARNASAADAVASQPTRRNGTADAPPVSPPLRATPLGATSGPHGNASAPMAQFDAAAVEQRARQLSALARLIAALRAGEDARALSEADVRALTALERALVADAAPRDFAADAGLLGRGERAANSTDGDAVTAVSRRRLHAVVPGADASVAAQPAAGADAGAWSLGGSGARALDGIQRALGAARAALDALSAHARAARAERSQCALAAADRALSIPGGAAIAAADSDARGAWVRAHGARTSGMLTRALARVDGAGARLERRLRALAAASARAQREAPRAPLPPTQPVAAQAAREGAGAADLAPEASDLAANLSPDLSAAAALSHAADALEELERELLDALDAVQREIDARQSERGAGCALTGSARVAFAPGRLSVTPGLATRGAVRHRAHHAVMHSPAQRRSSTRGALRDAPVSAAWWNGTHAFRSLSFGAPFPGQRSPLQRAAHVALAPSDVRYVLTVVPAEYESRHAPPATAAGPHFEYAASRQLHELRADSALERLPGVHVAYEISPLKLRVLEARAYSPRQFAYRLLSIGSNLFIVGQIVDRVLQLAIRLFARRGIASGLICNL